MPKPIITFVDCIAGTTEVREMTDEEFAHYEAINAPVE